MSWAGLCLLGLLLGPAAAHPRSHPKDAFQISRLKVQWNSDVQVAANITTFEQQRQPVEVSWQGIQEPSAHDMIALYVPANASMWHRLPVQFASCAALDSNHMVSGSGKARFVLLNMRSSFRFVLLRGGVVDPTIVAQSEPIFNSIPRYPTGGHLALHTDQRSVVVQWISAARLPQQLQWVDSKGPPSVSPGDSSAGQTAGSTGSMIRSTAATTHSDVVTASGAAGSDVVTASGTESNRKPHPGRWWRFTASSGVTTYNRTDMCGYPANSVGWLDPGFIHTAIIPAATLIPGERYIYRYGQDGSGWSAEGSFIAPVGPGVQNLRNRRTHTSTCAGHTADHVTHAETGAASDGQVQQQHMGDMQHDMNHVGREESQHMKGHTGSSMAMGRVKGMMRIHQDQDQRQHIGMAGPRVGRLGGQQAVQHMRMDPSSVPHMQHGSSTGGGSRFDDDDEEQPFVFLAFNDVCMSSPLLFNNYPGGLHFADNYGENSTWLSTRLTAEADAHLALLVGDLAYAMGYGADWDVFGDQFESVFRQWPMAVGTGNHERDWPGTGDAFGNTARDSGGECNVPFMRRWYTPANIQGDPGTSYYSFSQGPVHFLVLDSESPSHPDSPQGRFVAADLAAVNRTVTPWIVVALHRMMVAPATWRHQWVGDVDNMERLQSDYEELFRQNQVDVVIQGHEHAYARSCPMYRGRCTAQPTDVAAPHPPATAGPMHRWLLGAWQQVKAWLGPFQQKQPARDARAASSDQPYTCKLDSGIGGSCHTGKARVGHQYNAPAGGPVYLLAGHAGAGFTWGFPAKLPCWLEMGVQGVNGYLRFNATSRALHMDAVVARDGSVMDYLTLNK